MRPLPTIGQDPRIGAVEQLAVEAVKVLRSLEWSMMRKGDMGCPMCWRSIADGHHAGGSPVGPKACRLEVVLRRAAELGLT